MCLYWAQSCWWLACRASRCSPPTRSYSRGGRSPWLAGRRCLGFLWGWPHRCYCLDGLGVTDYQCCCRDHSDGAADILHLCSPHFPSSKSASLTTQLNSWSLQFRECGGWDSAACFCNWFWVHDWSEWIIINEELMEENSSRAGDYHLKIASF